MSTDNRQFRLAPPMGQFSRSGRTANLSDDEAFFSQPGLHVPLLSGIDTGSAPFEEP